MLTPSSFSVTHRSFKGGKRISKMIKIGVFHNGASDLPVKVAADGTTCNDGHFEATQAAARRLSSEETPMEGESGHETGCL
jgi:hypothetical protein